ncbi:MAG: dienelactone hydrolase family protein [Planctomycetes bacterium]|nr:dienelactone hydrolase family protein [Planctomycetota bacterium]
MTCRFRVAPLVLAACVFVAVGFDLRAQEEPAPSAEADQGSEKPSWTGVLDEKEFAALHQLKEADGKAPQLRGEMVRIGEGSAYLSLPKLPKGETPVAGVIVIHEWWGLNDHIKRWTDRLAADGYAAVAVDLYGGTVATTREEAMEAMREVDADDAIETLKAAHRFLASDPRIRAKKRASIGWCFGGGWSLRLAMSAPDLDAAVMYYGSLIREPARIARIGASMLGVFANQDRSIPPDAVNAFEAAMKKAGKSIEVLRFDANHAFANPSSARYDEKSATAAWARVRSFLDEKLRAQAGAFDLGDRKVQFSVPAGWKLSQPKPMRVVDFEIADGLQCYVSVLNGNGGGLAPNIRRWEAQLTAEPSTDEAIQGLPKLNVLGVDSVFATIDGQYDKGEDRIDARLLGVVCPLEGRTVYVKMIGPRALVAKHESDFRAFCKSMR